MLIAHDLDTAEKYAETVEELYLSGSDLVEWPRFIQHMPNLRVLDISNNRIRATHLKFSGMDQLRFLSLASMGLAGLPPELLTLESLENLRVSHNDFYWLPDTLADLKGLRVLEATHCLIDSFPVSLCQFPNLETLNLSNNELSSLPPAISGLRQLNFLNISNNKIFRLPSELALLPKLNEVLLEYNNLDLIFNLDIAEDLSRFLKQTANGKLSPEKRQIFMEVVTGQLPALAGRSAKEVVQALDAPYAEVRKRAPEVLYPALPDPFADGSPKSVCMLGQFPGLHKTKATRQLKSMQIEVSSKPHGDNCVVIAGDRPGKRLAVAFELGCKVGVESHLADFLAHQEGQYLSAGKGSGSPMVANILQMLRTGNPETLQLALNLMASGGIPKDVISELVGLSMFDRKNKFVVGEFLETHGSKRINRYLKTIPEVVKSNGGINLSAAKDALEMILRHPELDRVVLLRHAVKGVGMDQFGFAEVLELPEPLQKDLLPLMMTGETLSFFGMKLPRFPRACIQLPGLTNLILDRNKIEDLPADISQMVQLNSLSLSSNHIQVLPQSFCDLPALATLHLQDNRLHELPEAIGKMKSLQSLVLANNPLKKLPKSLAEADTLRYLNLSQVFRDGVPEMISQIDGLESVNLEDCGITNLDDWHPTWQNMNSLALPHNPLERIPEWVGEQRNLRLLDFSHCPANRLPESLRGMQQLEYLGLPMAKNLDWDQVDQILRSIPSLIKVYYDRSANPGMVSKLSRGRRGIRFDGYKLKK